MLLTILKYYLNIFKNLYTKILGAPHNLQVISKSSDTEMATFLAENSKKIDDKNLNMEVTIRLAVCFKKETVLEFLAKNGENENEVPFGDTVLNTFWIHSVTYCCYGRLYRKSKFSNQKRGKN